MKSKMWLSTLIGILMMASVIPVKAQSEAVPDWNEMYGAPARVRFDGKEMFLSVRGVVEQEIEPVTVIVLNGNNFDMMNSGMAQGYILPERNEDGEVSIFVVDDHDRVSQIDVWFYWVQEYYPALRGVEEWRFSKKLSWICWATRGRYPLGVNCPYWAVEKRPGS